MFVTKKTHNAIVSQLESRIAELKAGEESVIVALNNRICDLQKQIEGLHQLVFPSASSREISKEAREIDAIISVSEKPLDMSEEELTKILEGQRELDLLTSGNYSEDWVQ